MKNVYLVRLSYIQLVFSTPRKAIEFIKEEYKDGTQPDYTTYKRNTENDMLEIVKTEDLKDVKTAVLIKSLNKEGFLTFYQGGDCLQITREIVQ